MYLDCPEPIRRARVPLIAATASLNRPIGTGGAFELP